MQKLASSVLGYYLYAFGLILMSVFLAEDNEVYAEPIVAASCCTGLDMSQFGFNNSHHWGYGTSSGYSSWPSPLSGAAASASAVAASGFNGSTLASGFSAAVVSNSNGHHTNHDTGVFGSVAALPEASNTTGPELEQQLMTSTHLHNGHNTLIDSSTLVPKYLTNPECLSGGARSLSDSSNGESPLGNDDLYSTSHNGHTMNSSMSSSSFHHHHHMHHHTAAAAGNSYHNSHYPMLPASLFYSQLYHGGPNTSRQMLDDVEQRCNSNVVSHRVTNDSAVVWRPY